MRPPSELRARVLASARDERSEPREHVQRRERVAMGLSLAAALGVFWAFDGARLAPRPPLLVVATATSALAVALLAVWAGLSRGRSSVGRPRWVLGLTLLLTPLVLFSLKVAASAEVAGMSRRWPERPGFRCLYVSCACLVVPLVAFFWARRRSVVGQASLRGAAAGAAIGAAVWVLLDLNCPVAYGPHLLLGHVLPLMLASLLGAGLGGPVLSLHHH